VKHLLQRRARCTYGDIQYEQGDGEPEHAVAEPLHPVLAEQAPWPWALFVGWHGADHSVRRMGLGATSGCSGKRSPVRLELQPSEVIDSAANV
jgi:hypothetical protein